MRNKYINYGIYENSFAFLIPLYENMPSNTGDLARINVNEGYNLALRNGVGSSASTILRDLRMYYNFKEQIMNTRFYNARIIPMVKDMDIICGEIWVEGNR